MSCPSCKANYAKDTCKNCADDYAAKVIKCPVAVHMPREVKQLTLACRQSEALYAGAQPILSDHLNPATQIADNFVSITIGDSRAFGVDAWPAYFNPPKMRP